MKELNRKTALKRTTAGIMAVLTVAGNLLAPAQLKLGTLSETAITAEAASLMGEKNSDYSWDSATKTLTIKKGISNINGVVNKDKDDLLDFDVNFGGWGIFIPREDVDPSMVEHVVIESGAVMPKTCQQLMSNFKNLKSFVVKSTVDAANVYNLESMFEGLTKLTEVDLSGLINTGNIDYIDNMFTGCSSIKKIDLSMINGENVGRRNWTDHKAIEHIRRAVAGCDQLEELNLTGDFLSRALENINEKTRPDYTIEQLLDELLLDNNSPYKNKIKSDLKKAFDEYEALKKDPYNWKATDWKWSSQKPDGSYDCTVTLKRKDPVSNKTVKMEASAKVTYVDDPQPTCHSSGTRTFSAEWTDPDNTANVQKADTHKTAPLPKYDHDYDVDHFEWSEDHTSAEAVLICKNNGCGDIKKVAADDIQSTEVAPTCTEGGYTLFVAYYDGVESETERVEGQGALGHTAGEEQIENEVPANCYEDGSFERVVCCAVYGEELSRVKETVQSPGHTPSEFYTDSEVDPTCTEDGGYDIFSYCTECGEELSREHVVVPAEGHKEGEALTENEIPATCTEDGSYENVVFCSVCGEEISRETVVVPAAGHQPAEAVEEGRVEATPIADGHYDLVVNCSVCGEELSRETITIPATGCTAKAKNIKVAFGSYIGLIYEVEMNEDILADEGAYATFEQNGVTTTKLVSEFEIDENNICKFRFNTVAKEFADTVTFRLFNSNGNAVKLDSESGTDFTETGIPYSVKKYAEIMTKSGSTEQMRGIADALNTYCQATQIYFEYNADDLDISEKVSGVTEEDLAAFKPVVNGNHPAGIDKKEITTVYVEANNLKAKYFLSEDADLEKLTFMLGEEKADITIEEITDEEGYVQKIAVITAKDILPEDFDKVYTFTVTDGTETSVIEASALSYAYMLYSKANQTDDAKDLAKATYLYYQAAKAFDSMLNG